MRTPLVFMLAACAATAQTDAPDPLAIVRRSVGRDKQNWERIRDYAFTKNITVNELNRNGSVKKMEHSTYDVVIIYGEELEKLVRKNGAPIPESEARKQQQKLDKLAARLRDEPEEKRRRREQERHREQEKAREFLEEIPEAYTFRISGEETVDGRNAWIVDCDPKTGYRPKHSRAGLLKKFRGRIWIDQTDYQWIRTEAEAIDTVSWGFILARLAKGSRVSFEQRKIQDDTWLPTRFDLDFSARLGLIKSMAARVNVTYEDYKKFQSESRVVSAEEIPEPSHASAP